MKLKKIVKHLDFLADAEVYMAGYGDVPVWKGSMVYLQTAALLKDERKKFFAECEADNEFKPIKKVKKAMKFMNCPLDTCIDYKAVSAKRIISNNGIGKIIFIINIKPEEDENGN